MSRKVSVNIDIMILIALTDEFKNDSRIFLFLSIFAHQEVVDCRFRWCSIDGHIDNNFVSNLSFFFDLNAKGNEDCAELWFFEFLFNSNGWMSELLCVFRIWRVNCDVVDLYFIVFWVFLIYFAKSSFDLLCFVDGCIERSDDVRGVKESFDGVLVD